MSPISKALDDIKYTIPIQLLEIVFMSNLSPFTSTPLSLDELISTKVIRTRVLTDANLVGGQMAVISLDGLLPQYSDNWTYVYKIPMDRTEGRSILSALSIGYLPYGVIHNGSALSGSYSQFQSYNSELAIAGQRVGDSVSSIPGVSVGTVDLIGENTIYFKDNYRIARAYLLRCTLANEENLNNINPRSYPAFSQLCILAVKSYIHNYLVVRIDQAYLQGGQQLGIIKELVDEYKDAEELYQTHLKEVWRAVSFMNDTVSYDRLIKLMINPAL